MQVVPGIRDTASARPYDGRKVRAVTNEPDGYDHGRSHQIGGPATLGTDIPTVATAQKRLTADGRTGNGGATGQSLVWRCAEIDREHQETPRVADCGAA